MLFLIDEDVPVAIGKFLASRGHTVHYVVDVLVPGSEDPLLARWASVNNAVIVTCNDKDFKVLVARVPEGGRAEFRSASRLSLRCRQDRAEARVRELIEWIEFEYEQTQKRRDKRFILEISNTRVSAIR